MASITRRRAKAGAPGQTSLRERNKLEKRTRVLKAARELFSKKGYEATSMQAIATRADVGFGTIFLIAKSKRDLLFLLFRDDINSIIARMTSDLDMSQTERDIFAGMIDPYFDLFEKNIFLSRDYIREVTFVNISQNEDEHVLFGSHFYEAAKGILIQLRDQNRIREDLDIDIAAETLYATFMGAVRSWLRKDNPSASEGKDYLRAVYEIVVSGIK